MRNKNATRGDNKSRLSRASESQLVPNSEPQLSHDLIKMLTELRWSTLLLQE